MNRRNLRREAYVALVLDEDDCAGLCDGEVRARDAHPRGEEFAAQSLARDRRYLRDLARQPTLQLLGEEFRDLLARLVNRRHDDVRRLRARELNDVLAEVCLYWPDACGFERVVEFDLLGRH